MGWLFVTILLPLIAPFIGVLIFRPLPYPGKPPLSQALLQLVKDGQLCWAALGFCASALYEIDVPPDGVNAIVSSEWVGVVRGGTYFMMFISGMLAAGGCHFPTPLGVPPGAVWWRHYGTLVSSVWMTILSAALYAVIHYGIFQ